MGGGPNPEDVPLDADMLKVLAADTRRDILRLLQKRRMTLTELATALDLKKATVLEHLKRLTDANLVRRREDERLWVYYELTTQGGKLLNPGRTRFYIVMGIAAAAALLVGGLATVALVDLTDHDVHVALQREPVAGNVPVSLDVRLGLGTAGLRAYLLTPADAEALARDADDAPLRYGLVATPLGGAVRLESRDPVPPGDYLLYVKGEKGDNRDALVPVHLARYDASGPTRAVAGLDGPLRYEVTRDAQPARGSLLLVREGDVAAEVPIGADGIATVEAATLDALEGGTYDLMAKPRGSDVQVPLGRVLALDGPQLVLSPLQVAEGKAFVLTLALKAHDGAAPSVQVAGKALATRHRGGSQFEVDVPALPPGEAEVQVGRLKERITVHPDLRLTLGAREGQVELGVANLTGVALGGAVASLEGQGLGRTDAEGRLTFTPPARMSVGTLRVQADERTVERTLLFSGGAATPAPVRLRLDELGQTGGGATALVRNDGAGPVDATLSAYLDGTLVAAQKARLPAGGVTAFSFALPPQGGNVEVRVEPVRVTPVQVRSLDGTTPSTGGPVATTPVATSPDSNMTVEGDGSVRVQRLMRPGAIATPTTPSSGSVSSSLPAPEVPFPWALAPLALVGAALLLRRGRRGGGDHGG